MDPQAPTLVPEKPNFPEPPKPKDSHWITIASMAIFVLLSLGAVAFLYYQNQQLKSMLASYQSSPTPTATPDPTANWKTYKNQEGGYQYSYPNDWKNTEPCKNCEGPQNSSSVNDPSSKYPDGYFSVSYYDSSYCPTEQKVVKTYNWSDLVEKQVNLSGESGSLLQGTLDYNDDLQHNRRNILVTHNKTCYEIATWSYQNPDQEVIFDQILSTFKFSGSSPSPTSKACTMEAKLCLDGSYVGRTGPNCEFALCP